MIKWCLPQVACKQITQRCCPTKKIKLPKLLFSLCLCLHASKCNDPAKQWGNVVFIFYASQYVLSLENRNFWTCLEIKVMFHKDDLLRFFILERAEVRFKQMERNWFQHELFLFEQWNKCDPVTFFKKQGLPSLLSLPEWLCGLNEGIRLWCIAANILVYILLFGN